MFISSACFYWIYSVLHFETALPRRAPAPCRRARALIMCMHLHKRLRINPR
jgi:hypothetical protein